MNSTFIFDSKFTTYTNLSELNRQGVKLVTLHCRGQKLLEKIVELKDYDGVARQIILKGNGHEKPAFLITNDFESPPEITAADYTCRLHSETGISEAVKFFNINALSSPILLKVHFDMVMMMIADMLYWKLAQSLRGFEKCDANTIFRNFVHGKGIVSVKDSEITLTYPKRAHNPILRAVDWQRLPSAIPWLDDAKLTLAFI